MKIESITSCRICASLVAVTLTFLLASCDIESTDNLPDVPKEGLFMFAEANLHEDEDTAEVSAAVFNDGLPVDLIAGDVFEARTATERVLLDEKGFYKGSYAESIPADGDTQAVIFNVVHEPVVAREKRWYPVDLLSIDPGPGEFVGKSATINFPPAVTITGPAPDAEYTSIDDMVDLTWVAGGMGDSMRVLSAIACTDGLATSTYGTIVEIDADDGLESIGLNKFIYDIYVEKPVLTFIKDVARSLLQELLNKLSTGKIEPDYLASRADANPIDSDCAIQLFLQRQRDGSFDTSFANGNVVGSRSADVTIRYVPQN